MQIAKDANTKRTALLAIGSLGSALIGSSCILGPVLFAGAGTAGLMGSLAAGSEALIPYEPFFWLLALTGIVAGLIQLKRSAGCRRHCPLWLWGAGSTLAVILGSLWIMAVAR